MDLNIERSDQDRINNYSWLINRRNLLQSYYTVYQRERDNQKDSVQELEELELLSESPEDTLTVPFRVGSAFIKVPFAIAKEEAGRLQAQAEEHLAEYKVQLEKTEEEMEAVKRILTSKFGSAIRLD